MGTLLLLFIALPAVELLLLLELGRQIGVLETVAVIVLTGVVGASLARSQGLRVLSQAQREVAEGKMPADPLTDGVMILLAAALLITPGVLTDAFGFLCLLPAFRALVKRKILHRFEQAIQEGRVHTTFQGSFRAGTAAGDDLRRHRPRPERSWRRTAPRGPIVDVNVEPVDDSSTPNVSGPGDVRRSDD